MRFAKPKLRAPQAAAPLKLGYVPTLDAIPIIAAAELQLFADYGVRVSLERELGLGSLRERLIHEEIELASTQANMAITTYVGLGSIRRHCVSGLIFGVSPRILILSNDLIAQGIHSPADLARHMREHRQGRKLIFGAVQEHSTHVHYLKAWLSEAEINRDDVELVILPSTMLYESMRKGLIDAYCAAEPWASLGVLEGHGERAFNVPGYSACLPDRALLVLREFAEKHHEEHVRIIAALIEASLWCTDSSNHDTLARWLAQDHCFDIPYEAALKMLELLAQYSAPHRGGPSKSSTPDSSVTEIPFQFDLRDQGRPTRDRARLILSEVVHNLPKGPEGRIHVDVLGRIFREDIFQQALSLVSGRGRDRHTHSDGKTAENAVPVVRLSDSPVPLPCFTAGCSTLSDGSTNPSAPATQPKPQPQIQTRAFVTAQGNAQPATLAQPQPA